MPTLTPNAPDLETPRLRLRGFQHDDFEQYAAMWTEPTVVRFIGGTPLTREAAWSRFLRQVGHWQSLGFGLLAIEDKESGALIGEAGFYDLRRGLSPSLDGTLEAAWVLAPAGQGKGMAEEAMRSALGWANGKFGDRRITCIIRSDHAASCRVATKLGFQEVAKSEYAGKAIVVFELKREHSAG